MRMRCDTHYVMPPRFLRLKPKGISYTYKVYMSVYVCLRGGQT
jgi:hypothetical protein